MNSTSSFIIPLCSKCRFFKLCKLHFPLMDCMGYMAIFFECLFYYRRMFYQVLPGQCHSEHILYWDPICQVNCSWSCTSYCECNIHITFACSNHFILGIGDFEIKPKNKTPVVLGICLNMLSEVYLPCWIIFQGGRGARQSLHHSYKTIRTLNIISLKKLQLQIYSLSCISQKKIDIATFQYFLSLVY